MPDQPDDDLVPPLKVMRKRLNGVYRADSGFSGPTRRYVLIVALLVGSGVGADAGRDHRGLATSSPTARTDTMDVPFLPPASPGPVRSRRRRRTGPGSPDRRGRRRHPPVAVGAESRGGRRRPALGSSAPAIWLGGGGAMRSRSLGWAGRVGSPPVSRLTGAGLGRPAPCPPVGAPPGRRDGPAWRPGRRAPPAGGACSRWRRPHRVGRRRPGGGGASAGWRRLAGGSACLGSWSPGAVARASPAGSACRPDAGDDPGGRRRRTRLGGRTTPRTSLTEPDEPERRDGDASDPEMPGLVRTGPTVDVRGARARRDGCRPARSGRTDGDRRCRERTNPTTGART